MNRKIDVVLISWSRLANGQWRLVLPRAFLASCAFIAVVTLVFTRFNEAQPVLGGFSTGIMASLTLWVYLRLGFTWEETRKAMDEFP